MQELGNLLHELSITRTFPWLIELLLPNSSPSLDAPDCACYVAASPVITLFKQRVAE
jgi:hypothetical protein